MPLFFKPKNLTQKVINKPNPLLNGSTEDAVHTFQFYHPHIMTGRGEPSNKTPFYFGGSQIPVNLH